MSFADASGTRLAYIAEVTEGTTPSTPGFTNLRYTGETLKSEKQTATSNEIRADGNVPDVAKVGHQAGGGIDFELTYGTFDALLQSALSGTWATDVLVNGRDRHSVTLEKTFETGGTDVYRRYLGCMVNTTTLNFAAKQIVTGNMSVLGRSYDADDAIISSATYAAANTNAVMDCASGFASLTIGGVSPALSVKNITLNITTNLRGQDKLGTDDLAGIGLGQVLVTGSAEAYLENKSLLDLIDDHTRSNLSFTVGTVTNEKYTFDLPGLYAIDGDANAQGNNTDVMVPFEFQAVYDSSGSPANDHTMKITRAVS